MKKIFFPFAIILFGFSFANVSCNKKADTITSTKESALQVTINQKQSISFDSTSVVAFYKAHPDLVKYQKEVTKLYAKRDFHFIWFDDKGIIEFAHTLYHKSKELDKEGLTSTFPYLEKLQGVFDVNVENTLNQLDAELLLTNLYVYYVATVYKGLDDKTTTEIGWLLPKKQVAYENLIDSLISDPKLLEKGNKLQFSQYYKLRDVLARYREIEKKGGWNAIDLDPALKSYKPGDTAKAIMQIRARLFASGDIEQNSKSNLYDSTLVAAVKKYQLRNGKVVSTSITANNIKEMNVPIGERIKQIIVNMERCRWVSPEFEKANEYLVVNIPSYKVIFFRDGKIDFQSPVVVGATMNKTVIFSGKMSYIVFSPYWNLPQSIIEKEVKPGIAKNRNYLANHNMEWNKGQVRQKPGVKNSLGLVKFMFPNSNNIYLHDTPSKSLFAKETRAFSHGCIRVGKPRDLALAILKNDKNWTPEKIDAAMHAGKESTYVLKNKIPVYIGYFTAWVDDKGEINFYDDVYQRDERLSNLILSSK